ncbi:MAG: DUF192 domain-containing protein [Acidobacteria bacterium]|nr:DUF192 domain-containing protein [Acidobacteriota bacterium]
MSLAHWLKALFLRHRCTEPCVRFTIVNRTRQTELARCVEVAGDAASRRKGLLGRKTLSAGEGLWIVPCEAVHTFGMQFPIDLVYMDRNKRVKKIRHSVPARRFSACLSACSVIELTAGAARRAGTRNGDELEFTVHSLEGKL